MKYLNCIYFSMLFFTFFCSWLTAQEATETWFHPTNKNVQTIYYQGMGESQTQCAKYTGRRGFIATTGEHVICPNGIDIIENPFIGREISEVIPAHIVQGKFALSQKIVAAVCHPIRTIFEIRNSAHNKTEGIIIEPNSDANSLETIETHSLKLERISIAQDNDIADHKMRYESCVQQYPEDDLILFGPSRGAATTFNAAAFNEYDFSRIHLIVLEGCFDTVPHILKMRHPWLLASDSVCNAVVKILTTVTSFKQYGKAPLTSVEQFPEQIPVIFITSAADTSVNPLCTQRLIDALHTRGKNTIYCLTLKHSSHPRYMMDDLEDSQNYRDCIHALYKRLNLPYIPQYAQAGEQKGLLELCKVC
jgi:hypothetical protein